MSIEKKENQNNSLDKSQKLQSMQYPRYFSYVGALPLVMLLLLLSSCFSANTKLAQSYNETILLKTETEKLTAEVNDLESKKQAVRDSMIKERAKLSLEESVKRSWDIQNIEKVNNPILDNAKAQLTAKKLAWESSSIKLEKISNTRRGLIVSLSILFSWLVLSSLMYYSIRDYKPAILISLGVGVSVVSLMIARLYPVLAGYIILR